MTNTPFCVRSSRVLQIRCSENQEASTFCTVTSMALRCAEQTQRGNREKAANSRWGKNESFQRETNNLQFKCRRDQPVPPHMQIDANDMQMDPSKPGFANVLCQAVSDKVQQVWSVPEAHIWGPGAWSKRSVAPKVSLPPLPGAQAASRLSSERFCPAPGLLSRQGLPLAQHCTPGVAQSLAGRGRAGGRQMNVGGRTVGELAAKCP
jgi:hypothetical protein